MKKVTIFFYRIIDLELKKNLIVGYATSSECARVSYTHFQVCSRKLRMCSPIIMNPRAFCNNGFAKVFFFTSEHSRHTYKQRTLYFASFCV